MPLPILLDQMDLYILNSSVSIEATQLGLTSLLLDPDLLPEGALADYSDDEYQNYIQKIGDDYFALCHYFENNNFHKDVSIKNWNL